MKIYNKSFFVFGLTYLIIAFLFLFLELHEQPNFKSIIFLILLFLCSLIIIGLSFHEKTSKKYNDDIISSQEKALEKIENKNVVNAVKFLNTAEKVSSTIGLGIAYISSVLTVLVLFLCLLSN